MNAPPQEALRAQAINSAMAVLDDPLFKALQEPSRVAVLRQLMLLGRADVGQIAEKLPVAVFTGSLAYPVVGGAP